MDFLSILNAAQDNVSTENNKKFYSTKFAPPKKETKEKKLSNNIKKFLEKQKQDELEKQRIAHEKKMLMLAKRDPKIQRKIDKTLKVLKSSKKFYTGDKTLDENTAITLQNDPTQPDEDDYGFASTTSDQFYKKLMEKYNKLPKESDKSSQSKKVHTTKVQQDDLHINHGHRKRVSKLKSDDHNHKTLAEVKPIEKTKPKIKAAPVVNFEELLKLAALKQHEDILIDVPSKKTDERPLTLKEKKELAEIEAARKAKLKASKIQRIPKLGNASTNKSDEISKQDKNNNDDSAASKKRLQNGNDKIKLKSTSGDNIRPSINSNRDEQKIKEKSKTSSPKEGSKLRDALTKSEKITTHPTPSAKMPVKKILTPSTSSKIATTSSVNKNDKLKKSPESTKTNLSNAREFPPRDLQRAREFPPRDVQRARELPKNANKRPLLKNKRVIEDSDSEYDSEMDDFIDDGDEELDYSSEIRKIFKYDKSRFRDEDFDDREMESDFRTIQREEYISKKIGIMEDLEDIRKEAEEKKMKDLARKKQRLK